MNDILEWWRVRGRDVTRVRIERFNDTSVWINGRRSGRFTQWDRYYPTFAEAKASIVDGAEKRVLSLRRQLEQANDALGNAKGMKEPQE
jgi:hypothetical protein